MGKVNKVNVSKFGNDMLAANVNDMQKAHDSSVQVIKVYVTFMKQDFKFFQEGSIISSIIESPVPCLKSCHQIIVIQQPKNSSKYTYIPHYIHSI